MSILDTTRENETLANHEADVVSTPAAVSQAPTTSPAIQVVPAARVSRVARFLTALRHGNVSARDRALLSEPAIYEEYRASLARQEMARELTRRS